MCCTRLAENRPTGRKNSPSAHHRTTLLGYIFATKACIVKRKRLIKTAISPHTCSQYGERRPTNGWDRLASFGHPSKNQRIWPLAFVTARCLAVFWAVHYFCIFGALAPTEFCQVQNSPCVHVLRSPILTALLHGARAVGVSQTAAWYLHATEWPSRSTQVRLNCLLLFFIVICVKMRQA